jgi:hypothetical protein
MLDGDYALADSAVVAYTFYVYAGITHLPAFSSEKRGPPSERGRGEDRAAWVRRSDGSEAVARYLADMTAQLESMARAADLELLAYLLAMARSEADSISRKPPRAANVIEP